MITTESPLASNRVETSLERDDRDDLSLVAAILDLPRLQDELYVRYWRPLLQVFLHPRIARDAAEDLLQRTFLQAIKKIRVDGLDDPANLGGYLYRTACKLLEERLDHEKLAQCVRALMNQLPKERDREVLERLYLREETRTVIRQSLQLTELQFNHVLWRARRRFGDILRRHGLADCERSGAAQTTGI